MQTLTNLTTLDFILDDTNNVLFSVLNRYDASREYSRFEVIYTSIIATDALRQYADDVVRNSLR